MSAVSSFYGEFGLDIEPFIKGVRDIQREAKSIEGSLKPLRTAAEDLGKTFAATGAAITGVLTIMVKQSSDYGESLNKVSIQTGITTEKLSALKYMAEQEEASFEALELGLKRMSVTAAQNALAFDGIGVKVKESGGALRPMNDILLDVAKRFASMNDETKRTALEVEIFGRSGADLNEFLLRLGREGLDPSTQKVRQLGLEMSGNTAKAADDFNDSLKEISNSILGFSNAVAGALIPKLTDETHALRDAIIGAKDFVKQHEGLTEAVTLAGLGLTGAGGLLLGLAGIVTVYPKVVVGLKAIQAGLAGMSAEMIVATGGVAALIGLWAFLDEKAAEQVKNSKDQSDAFKKLQEDTMKQAKALDQIGVHLEQGTTDWKTYADQIRTAAAINSIALTDAANNQGKFHIRTAAEIAEEIRLRKEQEKIDAKYREAMAELYSEQVKRAAEFVRAWLEGFDRTSRAADSFTDSLQKQQVAASELSKTSLDAAAAAGDAWEEANGKTFNSAAKLFNEINGLRHTDLDENLEILTKVVASEEKAAKQTAQAWKSAIENLNTRIAESFANMIVHAKFTFSSLVSIAQEAAGKMLSAFLSGLLSPLTNALAGLGAKLANVLTGGGATSILGGLGRLLGIGGSSAAAAGGTAAAGGAVAGTSAGISGGALLAFATNPITIGVAAAAAVGLAIKHFVGQGREQADKFGAAVQAPFGAALSGIIDPFDRLKAAGRLTLDQATAAYDSLTSLWNSFTTSAAQFATQGKDQAKVVAQAFSTMTQNFGPNLKNLFDKINSAIVDLSGKGAASAGSSAVAGLPDTGRAVSASTIFADAVAVFKAAVDRAASGQGAAAGPPLSVQLTISPAFDIRVDSPDLAFEVRDVIIPKLLEELSLGMNTATTRLIQILKSRWAGVVTAGGAVA